MKNIFMTIITFAATLVVMFISVTVFFVPIRYLLFKACDKEIFSRAVSNYTWC
jgi:hypothetical protein